MVLVCGGLKLDCGLDCVAQCELRGRAMVARLSSGRSSTSEFAATTHVGGDASARAPTNDPVLLAKYKRAKAELENVLESAQRMHVERDACRAKIQHTKATIECLRRDIARECEATARIRAEREDVELENARRRRVEHDAWMTRARRATDASTDSVVVVDARIARDYARKLCEIDAMSNKLRQPLQR